MKNRSTVVIIAHSISLLCCATALLAFLISCDDISGSTAPPEPTTSQGFNIRMHIQKADYGNYGPLNTIGSERAAMLFTIGTNVSFAAGENVALYRITERNNLFPTQFGTLFNASPNSQQHVSFALPKVTEAMHVQAELLREASDGQLHTIIEKPFTIPGKNMLIYTDRTSMNEGEAVSITFQKSSGIAARQHTYHISGVSFADSPASGRLFSNARAQTIARVIQKDSDKNHGRMVITVREGGAAGAIVAQESIPVFDVDQTEQDCAASPASACYVQRSIDPVSHLPAYSVLASQGRIEKAGDVDWFRARLAPGIVYEVLAQTTGELDISVVMTADDRGDDNPLGLLEGGYTTADDADDDDNDDNDDDNDDAPTRAFIDTHHAEHWVQVRGTNEHTGTYQLQIKQYTPCTNHPEVMANYYVSTNRSSPTYDYQRDGSCVMSPGGVGLADRFQSNFGVFYHWGDSFQYNSAVYTVLLEPNTKYRFSLTWQNTVPPKRMYLSLWHYQPRLSVPAPLQPNPVLFTVTREVINELSPDNQRTSSITYVTTDNVRPSMPLLFNFTGFLQDVDDENGAVPADYQYPYRVQVEKIE